MSSIVNIIITIYGIVSFVQANQGRDYDDFYLGAGQMRTYESDIDTNHILFKRIQELAANITCGQNVNGYYEYDVIINKDIEACSAEGFYKSFNSPNSASSPQYVLETDDKPTRTEPTNKIINQKNIGEEKMNNTNVIVILAAVLGILGIGIAGYYGVNYIISLLRSDTYRFPDV